MSKFEINGILICIFHISVKISKIKMKQVDKHSISPIQIRRKKKKKKRKTINKNWKVEREREKEEREITWRRCRWGLSNITIIHHPTIIIIIIMLLTKLLFILPPPWSFLPPLPVIWTPTRYQRFTLPPLTIFCCCMDSRNPS